MKNTIMLAALLNIAVFAQGTFTDPRDGKTYKTVKIGEETWMAQNLDYHGNDGFLGLCYGDEPKKKISKPENCKKYGRLYDREEAMKACPTGWYLPSEKEWQALVDFVGGGGVNFDVAGKLKAKDGWEKYDFSGESSNAPKCKWTKKETDNRGRVIVTEYDKCATDEYGFSALPGGKGTSDNDFPFLYAGEIGNWWSSDSRGSYFLYIYMSNNFERVRIAESSRPELFSVRCLKD